jgi:hypothetical protein
MQFRRRAVQYPDKMSMRQQAIHQMRTDESRSAENQDAHQFSSSQALR